MRPGKGFIAASQEGKILALSTTVKHIFHTFEAMTEGTIYSGYLPNSPVLDLLGFDVGEKDNTGIVFTGGVFLARKEKREKITINGDYEFDEASGYYKVKAGASATPTAAYDVRVALQSKTDFTIIASGEVEVITAGTPVALPSNVNAKAVAAANNNVDGKIAVVGKSAVIDALSTPKIGRVLNSGDSTPPICVEANSNEIAVDANESRATAVPSGVIAYGVPDNGDTIIATGFPGESGVRTFTKVAADPVGDQFTTIEELNALLSGMTDLNATEDDTDITLTVVTPGSGMNTDGANRKITGTGTYSALSITFSGGNSVKFYYEIYG